MIDSVVPKFWKCHQQHDVNERMKDLNISALKRWHVLG